MARGGDNQTNQTRAVLALGGLLADATAAAAAAAAAAANAAAAAANAAAAAAAVGRREAKIQRATR